MLNLVFLPPLSANKIEPLYKKFSLMCKSLLSKAGFIKLKTCGIARAEIKKIIKQRFIIRFQFHIPRLAKFSVWMRFNLERNIALNVLNLLFLFYLLRIIKLSLYIKHFLWCIKYYNTKGRFYKFENVWNRQGQQSIYNFRLSDNFVVHNWITIIIILVYYVQNTLEYFQFRYNLQRICFKRSQSSPPCSSLWDN